MDIYSLFTSEDVTEHVTDYQTNFVKIFPAVEIFKLHEKLMENGEIELASGLRNAVFCEIVDDTKKGRGLSNYFTKMRDSQPKYHFARKVTVEITQDFKLNILDTHGKNINPEVVLHNITLLDVFHEIYVQYGKRARHDFMQQLMGNPAYFDVELRDRGGFEFVSQLDYVRLPDCFGGKFVFDAFIFK